MNENALIPQLVEATITPSCNSPHTARNYRRGIGEFITLLGRERFDGAPLVEQFQHGKHKASVFDYGEIPAAVLLLVNNAILDKFNRERKQAAYAVKTLLAVAYRDNIITQQTQAVSNMAARYGHGAGLAPLVGDNRLTPHDTRRTLCA